MMEKKKRIECCNILCNQGVPVGKFQFKIILKTREGEIVWQPGPDRNLHTWEAMNRITVCEDWDNAEQQKVTEDDGVPNIKEEDQLANTNKEFQMESEMPNFAENLGNSKEKLKSILIKC